MKFRYVFLAIALFIFLSLVPVLINQLMRIDWFSNVVVGDETIWISFYGSYMGGIIGGLLTLVGVMLTINYQNKTKRKTVEEKNEKGIRIIDNIIDKALVHLTFFLPALKEDYVLEDSTIKIMKMDLAKLKKVTKEMNGLPWEVVPQQYFKEFTLIKELINILEVEINSILENETFTNIEIQEQLNKVGVERRVRGILSHYVKFTEEKELMEGLLHDLNDKFSK
ncbi:hypothetical protein [Bacillus sp. FJAT-45037]|uniref:hypothetical protein n=1 Tax=Bacillus sp. FJAT-45037 TaxID=2011007 RepID=UPI000C238ADA|nr:hypothetical protein [Bacillus sp. FJAT-45037]